MSLAGWVGKYGPVPFILLRRIRTCTREPVLRLFFVLVALVLRNVWVWLHFTYFATRRGRHIKLHLECLRFRRMLDWIARVITNLLHDHSQLFTQARVV